MENSTEDYLCDPFEDSEFENLNKEYFGQTCRNGRNSNCPKSPVPAAPRRKPTKEHANQFRTSNFCRIWKNIGKIAALLILVLILALNINFAYRHTEDELLLQDVTVLKQLIKDMNNKLNDIESDASHLFKVVDNYNLDHNPLLLVGVDDELDRLRNTQQSFEQQMRKMNVRFEVVAARPEGSENAIWSIVNGLKVRVCKFGTQLFPKQLEKTFCSDSNSLDLLD